MDDTLPHPKTLHTAARIAGLLIPFWLALGVYGAGLLYPGYSHINQAMSELGAIGAPTHTLSPLINNFPLGILFIAFGASLCSSFPRSKLALFSGVMIIGHGAASFVTGYFSCDAGCGLENPSPSQQIHNLAGLVMFLTLVIASTLWIYLSLKLLNHKGFAWFSLACTLAAVSTLPLMGNAIEAKEGFGFYQRLNYGASVIWIAGLAWMLIRLPARTGQSDAITAST